MKGCLVAENMGGLLGRIMIKYQQEQENSHYENIKKVYSIWICMNPPKNRENSITRYYIAEKIWWAV